MKLKLLLVYNYVIEKKKKKQRVQANNLFNHEEITNHCTKKKYEQWNILKNEIFTPSVHRQIRVSLYTSIQFMEN